jgi:hypothetical protein
MVNTKAVYYVSRSFAEQFLPGGARLTHSNPLLWERIFRPQPQKIPEPPSRSGIFKLSKKQQA